MSQSVFIVKTTKITPDGKSFKTIHAGEIWDLPDVTARKLIKDGLAREVVFEDTHSHTKDLGAAPHTGGVVPGFSSEDPPAPSAEQPPKRKRGRPRKNPLL
jgi:hypothetical protein